MRTKKIASFVPKNAILLLFKNFNPPWLYLQLGAEAKKLFISIKFESILSSIHVIKLVLLSTLM